MSFVYKGWDVHAYTSQFRDLTRDLKLPAVSAEEIRDVLNKLKEKSGAHLVGVHNVESSLKDGVRLEDPDLGGFDTAPLFVALFKLNPEMTEEILIEIAGTCLQGITHRLLQAYLVLQE